MPYMPVTIGLTLFGVGALVACLNFYTSFLRYPLHRWRGGTRADFRWVSGFPLVGIVCLLLAAGCLRDHPILMGTALVLALLDTSGPHWLAASMICTLVRRRRASRGEGGTGRETGT
jgi:hypothetical protein